MLHRLKKRFYFAVATYFAFWAKFVLRRWNPQVIVITGSSGKTTVLHLIESQLGDQAMYSHHANSAIGIPFHILGMEPNILSKAQWLKYLIIAPFHSFRSVPTQKIYIVEADCDRPHEGKFTSHFLKPEVTLWVSIYRTHSMNFDSLIHQGLFKTHEDAIAYEFGYFIENTSKLVLINGDQPAMTNQVKRVGKTVEVKAFSLNEVTEYKLDTESTFYKINDLTLRLKGLHPKDLAIGLQMINELLQYIGVKLDPNFSQLRMPPGRSNLLQGKNGTILIDSTYNTGLGATMSLLELFKHYSHQPKWLVIGDILEQGSLEKEEHERLADGIIELKPERVVLLGFRTKTYTFPLLQSKLKDTPVIVCDNAKEVLDYLEMNLKGGEAILFKGAQGLEGVIEQLLVNPKDIDQLVRRGPAWVKRRQAWGLPR